MLRKNLDQPIDETIAVSETVLPVELTLEIFNSANSPSDAISNTLTCRFFNRLLRATSPFIKKDVKDLPNYTRVAESATTQLTTSDGPFGSLPVSFKHCLALNDDTIIFIGLGYLMGIIKLQHNTKDKTDYLFDVLQFRNKDWVVSPIRINDQTIAYPGSNASVQICEWKDKNDARHPTHLDLGSNKCLDKASHDSRLVFRKSDGMLIHLYHHPESKYTLDFYDTKHQYNHLNTTYLPELVNSLNVAELIVSQNDNLIFHDNNKIYVTNKTGEVLLHEIDAQKKFIQLLSLTDNKIALLSLSGIDIYCFTTKTCIRHIARPLHAGEGQYQLKVLARGELLWLDTASKVRKLSIFDPSSGEQVQDLTPKEMDMVNAVIMPDGQIISILDNNDASGNIYLQFNKFNAKPALQEEHTQENGPTAPSFRS